MSYSNRYMQQTLTYWEIIEPNGYGGWVFKAPVTICCRWEQKAVQFRTPQGEEVVSMAVVYVPNTLIIGDYVALGDHQDIDNPMARVDICHRIRQTSEITDLRNVRTERKVYL